jgi:hypothetical protein
MKPLLFSALLLSAPVMAQEPAQPATALAQAPEAVDPARLALAAATVDFIWPLGTYARMMGENMTSMVDSMMQSMFDMKLGDFAGSMPPPQDGKPIDPEVANATMRETIVKTDPHFEERLRIMNRVMMEEMAPVMTEIEPGVRSGLALALARKFTAAQLRDVNGFFATPTGRAYASESMMLWVDPEVTAALTKAMPLMVSHMPRIMEKVREATAHLPLPPRPRPEPNRRQRRRR